MHTNIQKEEKLSDKMLKVEQKINDIAQTVEQVGDITEKVGKGMQYAGNAMAVWPPTAAAGAALARAGGVTQKIGVVTQNVGQYGQFAAQTAMTLTYAAKGDISNALMSAGSAIQTGASAAKGSKEMKSQMKEIDNSVQEGLEKANVSLASREAAKQAKESGALEELGMSKKEYRKGVKEQLNSKLNDGSLSKDELLSMTKADDAGKQINGMIDTEKLKDSVAQQAAEKAKNGGQSVFKKAGNWLAENGQDVGRKLSAAGQEFAAKQGNKGSSAPTQQRQVVRPDFSDRQAVFRKKFG